MLYFALKFSASDDSYRNRYYLLVISDILKASDGTATRFQP